MPLSARVFFTDRFLDNMEYAMTRPAIIINELDAERIDRLLEQPAFANSPVADA